MGHRRREVGVIKIKLLGTAAGGGLPQWNCNCRVCRAARESPALARPRTQSGVALSADGRDWYLLNASPDLLLQIQNFPALQPRPDAIRNSPIQGVLLTNADLDHTLGLALLREGAPLPVYSTPRARAALADGLRLFPMLENYCGLQWRESPFEIEELCDRDGRPAGISVQAFDIPGSAPRYVRSGTRTGHGDSVGYVLTDLRTGGCLVFAPDVSRLDAGQLAFIARADVLLIDGTFWEETEMQRAGTGTATAADMGHLPINGGVGDSDKGGAAGSLALLRNLAVKTKVYVHINNTNPILLEASPEREIVRASGVLVGEDGMEFEV